MLRNCGFLLWLRRAILLLVAVSMVMGTGIGSAIAAPHLQTAPDEINGALPRSFQIAPVELGDVDSDSVDSDSETDDIEQATEAEISASHFGPPRRFIVDTDTGVDDAFAIIGLLSQQKYPVDVQGIVTVSGNTDSINAANNVLNILEQLGRSDIPVVVGAAAPLERTLSSTGKLIHGPDGLWFLGISNFKDEVFALPDDPVDYYCNQADLEGATLVALGPLTNIAMAVEQCAGQFAALDSLVVLGGAKNGGNSTPVAEFNFWQDPEAVEIVLRAAQPPFFGADPRIDVAIVPLDAFKQLKIGTAQLKRLEKKGNSAVQFVLPALQQYIDVQVQNGQTGNLPDAVAMAYALNPDFGKKVQSALVQVMTPPASLPALRAVRGQSLVALDFAERISLIATDEELSAIAESVFSDPNFDFEAALLAILLRQPDNAQFVSDVTQGSIRRVFMGFWRTPLYLVGSADVDGPEAEALEGNQVFLPVISAD